MWLFAIYQRCILLDEVRCSAAASSHDVDDALVNEFAYLRCHRFGSLVVESHLVGQPCIRVGCDVVGSFTSQFAQIRLHLPGAKRAVQSDGEDGVGAHRCEKGFERLSAERASGQIADSGAKHQGKLSAHFLHGLQGCIDAYLGVQCVEDSFNEQ